MTGREGKKANDLFYTCSLIEYIARKTKNRRSLVVRKMGSDRISKVIKLADIYHCENIDAVSDRFIEECKILQGDFDNVAAAHYAVPSYWDMGKVYKRLALGIAEHDGVALAEAVIRAYTSYVSEKLDDYNSSFYYDSPQAILSAYIYGQIE